LHEKSQIEGRRAFEQAPKIVAKPLKKKVIFCR
jgi:hypothetical protein